MLEERVAAVRADRQRGSAALADEALAILAEAARRAPDEGLLDAVGEVARALLRARPGMVAIEQRVHQVMADLHAADPSGEGLRDVALSLVEALRARAAGEREEAARCAARELDAARVLTVSWSDTALRALELAHTRSPLEVVVPAGWPLGDGLRAAQRLALAGLEVEVVPDAALAEAAMRCDAALVGADAVLGSGVVVNRAGTFLAALAMAPGGRPFLVACEAAKVTWREAVVLEEGAARDVWAPSPLLPVRVRHPLFDATPAELVRRYCTERGALDRGALRALAAAHRRRAAWLSEETGA